MKFNLTTLLLFFSATIFSQTNHYYFGNLHAHTAFSDGCKDSATSGIARPNQAYLYAKYSSHFDFLGISEHNHFSAPANPGFTVARYKPGLNAADSCTTSSFLALFGMEYGVTSTYNGHVTIYGFDKLLGWESGNYDIYNGKTDYDGLFRKIKNNPNAFAILAHPDITDFSTGGTAAGSIGNSAYNAMYDSAIVGVPLRSGPAFSTYSNFTDYATGNYFNYYTTLLSKGYHIGIGYDHDNHYTNFGRINAGRMVVISPDLTKVNFTKAVQQMHFYGSDDWNAQVDFKLNNQMMGSVMSETNLPTIVVNHTDGDGEQAAIIKLWRGVSGSNALPVVIYSAQGNNLTYADNNIQSGWNYYYFVEIIQGDSQWIVTSPIWYTFTGNSTDIRENTNSPLFKCFPNPTRDYLNISLSSPQKSTIDIFDIEGRKMRTYSFEEENFQICVQDLKVGVYVIAIKGDHVVAYSKLIIADEN